MMNRKVNKVNERVVILLNGKRAEVDADQVKLILKKEALVKEGMALGYMRARAQTPEEVEQLSAVISKIRRLNKRIRPTVRFLDINL